MNPVAYIMTQFKNIVLQNPCWEGCRSEGGHLLTSGYFSSHAQSVPLPTTELHCVLQESYVCMDYLFCFGTLLSLFCVLRSDVIWNE
jgi:hypothetical protein